MPRPQLGQAVPRRGPAKGEGLLPSVFGLRPEVEGCPGAVSSWMAKDTFRSGADPGERGWHWARGFLKRLGVGPFEAVFSGKARGRLAVLLVHTRSGAAGGGRRKCCLLLWGPEGGSGLGWNHDVPVRSACGVEVQIYTKHLARQEAFILTGGFEVISTTSVYRALYPPARHAISGSPQHMPVVSPIS